MESTVVSSLPSVPEQVLYDLRQLSIPVHLSGHRQLCLAIPLFAADTSQLMCDELYPSVAKALGYVDWRVVEFSVRRTIISAWEHGDSEVWKEYFPGITKAPSNKCFIATLAQRLK